MATYFYTLNDDGIMQIDDDYEAMVSIKSGSFTANVNSNQLYGLVLDSPSINAGFRITSGELFISPPVPYNGKYVVYVGADSSTTIYYEQFATCTNLSPSTSLAGMEIYNASGKVVFTTKYKIYSPYISHYARYYAAKEVKVSGSTTYFIKDDADSEIDIMNALEAGAMYAGASSNNPTIAMNFIETAIITNAPGVTAWSTNVTAGSIVQSINTPWVPALFTSRDDERYRVYMAGYKFSNSGKTISIGQKMSKKYIKTILGGGSIEHINKTNNKVESTGAVYPSPLNMSYGAQSHSYIFNIMKPY